MPVRDWLARVGQHFIPMVSPQALCVWSSPTHPNHLIVPDSATQEKHFTGCIKRDLEETLIPVIYMGLCGIVEH